MKFKKFALGMLINIFIAFNLIAAEVYHKILLDDVLILSRSGDEILVQSLSGGEDKKFGLKDRFPISIRLEQDQEHYEIGYDSMLSMQSYGITVAYKSSLTWPTRPGGCKGYSSAGESTAENSPLFINSDLSIGFNGTEYKLQDCKQLADQSQKIEVQLFSNPELSQQYSLFSDQLEQKKQKAKTSEKNKVKALPSSLQYLDWSEKKAIIEKAIVDELFHGGFIKSSFGQSFKIDGNRVTYKAALITGVDARTGNEVELKEVHEVRNLEDFN